MVIGTALFFVAFCPLAAAAGIILSYQVPFFRKLYSRSDGELKNEPKNIKERLD